MKPWLPSLLVAIGATASVLSSLGPSPGGPGVTCDELYHVGLMGKPLVAAVRQQGLAFLAPANVSRNFAWPDGGPPVQAPLGHWILGLTHHLFDPAPDNPAVISIGAARFAPALAFGLLVFLVGQWTWRRAGPLAGTVAALSTALMPRLFAHAHFAALDMFTTTSCVAALFTVTWAVRSAEECRPTAHRYAWSRFILAGVVWGMAMLIRLHGVLLLPPIAVWLLWRSGCFRLRPVDLLLTRLSKTLDLGGFRWKPPRYSALEMRNDTKSTGRLLRRGAGQREESSPFRPLWLPTWFLTGMATLWLGWPWLWLNPARNLWRYLASGGGRQAVHVFYLGRVWADYETPWHYPLLMFAWTVPLGFLAIGVCGGMAWLGRTGRGEESVQASAKGDFALVALAGGFLLTVFTWPGVPVYDGVRLFLLAFPLWAVFVGLGAKWLDRAALGRGVPRAPRLAIIGLVILLQATGLILYHPCQLSYYSLLAGGLRGAEHLGLEVTYWGDTIREPLLAEAAGRAPRQPVLFGPNLAPFQAPAVTLSSPSLAASETTVTGWDASQPETALGCRYALVYRRQADLATLDWLLCDGQVVAEHSMQGVWVARLMKIPAPVPPRRAELDE